MSELPRELSVASLMLTLPYNDVLAPFSIHHASSSPPPPPPSPPPSPSPPPPPPPPLLHVLYHYACVCMYRLGRGSYGEVYKVRSRDDGKLYAVKRSTRKFTSRGDRERRLEEVRSGRGLGRHPFCLEYLEAWEEDELYVVCHCDT